ncbi:enoyl-CoA hydratase-related protein [Gordonia aurantiaca]|uniref:enoyl-CoA hydratase-related protein n=1 Tax=Gordonia sp. B21 TaxID=3151852 RepID=UPI003266D209
MTSRYSTITYEVDRSGIAQVTLNRPDARNGYTVKMARELEHALKRADDDELVRVVVLAANGKDFCCGADLSDGAFEVDPSAGASDGEWQEPAGRCSMTVYRMSKPVIAAVQGAAVGAGATIILSADYRLAASDARFGFVFSRRGIYPEGASAWFLPRLVGMGTALDWMVSGRLFGADEAKNAGLVHSVHPAGELLSAARELAHDLVAHTAPVSVAVVRRMLYELSGDPTPDRTRVIDSRLVAGLAENPDAFEGVSSFLEKRPADFPGRVPHDLPAWLPWHSQVDPTHT